MSLEKTNSPVEIEICPILPGWADVYFNFYGKKIAMEIKDTSEEKFTDFMKLLYYMHPHNDKDIETEDVVDLEENYEDDNFGYDNRIEFKYMVEDEFGRIAIYEQEQFNVLNIIIQWRIKFKWEGDDNSVYWSIERIDFEDIKSMDFKIRINLELYEFTKFTKTYSFEMNYWDLCFALAKAYTEMIKKYGIIGYHRTVYAEDIHMRYFLFFKAYALGRLDLIEVSEDWSLCKSTFENEMELLLFDM